MGACHAPVVHAARGGMHAARGGNKSGGGQGLRPCKALAQGLLGLAGAEPRGRCMDPTCGGGAGGRLRPQLLPPGRLKVDVDPVGTHGRDGVLTQAVQDPASILEGRRGQDEGQGRESIEVMRICILQYGFPLCMGGSWRASPLVCVHLDAELA